MHIDVVITVRTDFPQREFSVQISEDFSAAPPTGAIRTAIAEELRREFVGAWNAAASTAAQYRGSRHASLD